MKGRLFRNFLVLAASAVLAFRAVPVRADDTAGTAIGSSASRQIFSGYVANVQYHQDNARSMLVYVNDFRTSGTAWVWNQDNATKTEGIQEDKLEYDYGLEEIAMQRAAEIAVNFDHTRPDGTMWYSCMSSDGNMSFGENIATGFSNTGLTFEQWKEEDKGYEGQGHRRNMLGDYQAIGIGCAEVNGQYFWVQEFGYKGTASDPGASTVKKNVTMNVAANMVEHGTYVYAKNISVTVGKTVEVPEPYVIATLKNVYGAGQVQITGGLNYSSSNSAVATTSGEKVTGNMAGECTLTTKLGNSTLAINLKVLPEGKEQMNRLYNPNSMEHFYTADESEKEHLVSLGWKDEGIGWYAPSASATPVYRLYNSVGAEHHYTYNTEERNYLISIGWKYEGIGWYSDDAKTVPLYRQYNPNATANNHNYTASTSERDHLLSLGWRDEKIGWYGVSE